MSTFKKNQIITCHIDALSHDGRGIANLEGKTTFIHGGLKGETVTCQLKKIHSRYNEAEVVEILTPSNDRTASHCPHFGVCGGCSLQHMNTDAQVLFKQNVLLEQLKHFGKVTPHHILPPIVGDPWAYRRKARLGVRYVRKKEKLLIGFREKSSNFLTDSYTCSVLHEQVEMRIPELRDVIMGLSQFEHIPQIEVAVSDQETAFVFRHMTDLSTDDIEKLCTFANKYHLHFYLQPNPPAKIHKIWPKNTNEKLTYFLPDYQLNMQFHPLDFIQINAEINKKLLKKTLELLQPQSTETILDLFCGLGNFTLPLAKNASYVVGVEGDANMVSRAYDNAKLNDIQNVEFHAANLMELTTNAPWAQKHYDKILLDPPRTGAKEIIAVINKFHAKRIAYVSCNPATLARDAAELVYTHKYELTHVGAVNMFPHTSHIEALAIFEK